MKIIRKRANEKKLKDKNKTTITTKGKNKTLIIKITNIKEKLGKTVFTHFSTRMAAWLLLTFFINLQNQLSSIHSITRIKEYRYSKNVIHKLDNKNEWLLLSASLTAKFGLVLVLTLENTFS